MRVNRRKLLSVLLAFGVITLAVLIAAPGSNRWEKTPDPIPVETPKNQGPGEPTPVPEPKLQRRLLQIPDDAVHLALADLETLPLFVHPFIRYIWVQDGEAETVKITSLVLNYVGRKSDPYLPAVLFDRHLVRVDLRVFWPREQDLKDVLVLWEEFGFDPTFSLLVTKDTLRFAEQLGVHVPRHKVRRDIEHRNIKTVKVPGEERVERNVTIHHKGGLYEFPDDSGRKPIKLAPGDYTVDLRWKTQVDKEVVETTVETVEEERPVAFDGDVNVVRFNPPTIDPLAFAKLQELTHSVAPVVEDRYFKFRSMRQIQDKGLFKDVWGGLYYKLVGIQKAEDFFGKGKVPPGVTDQDVFFQNFLGVGNIKGQLNARRLFDQIRSDYRYAILHSLVTGKPRIVVVDPTLADKYGQGKVFFTLDIKDEKVDFGDRGYENLLDPRFDAQEVIAQRANGLTYNVALNGEGALQDEVPFDVANDTTIPNGHTKRLQPASSCFYCHQFDGSDYWKPLKNDVLTIWGQRRPSLDTFGDLNQGRKAFSFDVIDRLAGLYGGNPIDSDKVLRRAREDVSGGTLSATGPWDKDLLSKDVCKKSSFKRMQEESDYWYSLVGAREALRTLGLDMPPEDAQDVFKAILPPDLRDEVAGFYRESPTVGAIREGLGVNATDWYLIQNFLAERSRKAIDQLRRTGVR